MSLSKKSNSKKNLKISFDFDGTLEDDFDGTLNQQKEEIQNLAKIFLKQGHSIYIITKRYGPEMSTFGLINEHLKVYKVAEQLGITQIFFTNREFKSQHIVDLEIDIHFENSDYEIKIIEKVCEQNGHKCLVVPVESKNWRELI